MCWKIEGVPKPEAKSQYTRYYIWIRKDNYVAAQIDSYRKETVVRRLKYSDFEKVQGIWTARTLEMADIERESRTILKFEKLQYNVSLEAERFTLQALRRES
jgi:hypothetical protein